MPLISPLMPVPQNVHTLETQIGADSLTLTMPLDLLNPK